MQLGLPLALSAMLLAGQCAAEEPPGGLDASAGRTCEELDREFEAFVEANRSCSRDEDCTLWGAYASCNCIGAYDYPESGPAIHRDALEEAERRFPTSAATVCPMNGSRSRHVNTGPCDAWWEGAECREGICRGRLRGHLSGPEACLPSARTDAGTATDAGGAGDAGEG